MAEAPRIAIILPVYNERAIIGQALTHVSRLGADELIVVDGGSGDGTPDVIRGSFPHCRLAESSVRQRSSQMNLGASLASSDILLFIHVDIRLPDGALRDIRRACVSFVGGGFHKCYDPTTFVLSVYAAFLNIVYLEGLGRLVGTNAIFVRRDVFERIGGFPETAFLEDVMFSSRLKKEGALKFIRRRVHVSSRRYRKEGAFRQMGKNAKILFDYHYRGKHPQELKEAYGKVKT